MRKEGVFFNLLLLLFILLILYLSLGFADYKTKLMPILVGTTTLILGVATCMVEIFPRFGKMFEVHAFRTESFLAEKHQLRWNAKKGFLIIFLWLLLFCLFLFFSGFYVAMFVCVGLFVKLYGNETWVKSLLVAAIATFALYGMFRVLMGVSLFHGILFGEIV